MQHGRAPHLLHGAENGKRMYEGTCSVRAVGQACTCRIIPTTIGTEAVNRTGKVLGSRFRFSAHHQQVDLPGGGFPRCETAFSGAARPDGTGRRTLTLHGPGTSAAAFVVARCYLWQVRRADLACVQSHAHAGDLR